MHIGVRIHTTDHSRYHQHGCPFLSLMGKGVAHATGTADQEANRAGSNGSTGPSPPDRGVQHQPDHRIRHTQPERGIHFGTVAPPDVSQRPTFAPESSLLWESSTLTVAQSARRPTAVPKRIPLLPDMGAKTRSARQAGISHIERIPDCWGLVPMTAMDRRLHSQGCACPVSEGCFNSPGSSISARSCGIE